MQNLINQATLLNTSQETFDGNRSPALVYLARQAAKAVQEAPLPTTMRGWALEYARLGYSVFPLHNIDDKNLCTCMKGKRVLIEHESGKRVLQRCTRDQPGKHPRIGSKFDFLGREYYQQATNSSCNINRWWTKWPNANIGLAPLYNQLFLDYDNKDTAKWFARFLEYDKVGGVLQCRRDRCLDFMLAGSYAAKSPRGYHAGYTTPILFASYHNNDIMVDGLAVDKNAMLDQNGKPLKFDVKCWRNFVVAAPSIVLKNMAKKNDPPPPPKWRRKHYKIINLLPPAPLPSKLEELLLEHLTVKHNPVLHGWITDITPNGWPEHILAKMSSGLILPDPGNRISYSCFPLPPLLGDGVTQPGPGNRISYSCFPLPPLLRDGVTPLTLTETQPQPQLPPQESHQIVTAQAIVGLYNTIDDEYELRIAMKVRETLDRYQIDRDSKATKRNKRAVNVVTSLINTSRSLGEDVVRRVTRGWLKAQVGAFDAKIEDAYAEIDDLIGLYWNSPHHSPQEKDYVEAWTKLEVPANIRSNMKMLNMSVLGRKYADRVLIALIQIVLWKIANAPTEMPLIWFTWNQVLTMTGLSDDKLKEHRKKFVSWPAVDTDTFHRGSNTASIIELLTEVDYGHLVHGKPMPGKFELNTINATLLGVI